MILREMLGVAPDGKLAVLEALLAGDSSIEDLVAASALPRRDVEEFLEVVDGLEGDRSQLLASYRASRAVVRPEDEPDLERAAAALIAGAPKPRKRFDHVQATPGTLVRRVKWLTERFDLSGRRVLFAGDHDLTSLLLAQVVPDAELTVADIDEDLLTYVDSAGEGRVRCGSVRCVWADFRFGLPPALAESADVVFTDPPYTPEGLGLFLSRSVSALRREEPGARIVVAYGHSRRRPDLGVAAQSEITRQNVVIDAMLPGFNRYDGAQAVGSASDLYCLAPAPTAFRCGGATPLPVGIYTHGSQSVESTGSSPADLAPLLARLAASGTVGVVSPGSGAFPDIAVRIGLGKLLADGVHPSVTGRADEIVVDLRDDPGPWLTRAMLALNAPRSVFVIPSRPETLARLMSGAPEWTLPRAKFESLSPAPSGDTVAIRCELAPEDTDDPGLALTRYVLHRAHGKLSNVWREGLVTLAAARGLTLAKRAASEQVDEAATTAGCANDLPLRLIDVPAARFPSLHAALRASATNTPGP